MKEKLKKIGSKINMKYLFLIFPIMLILLLIILSSIFTIENIEKESEKTKKEEKEEVKTVVYTTKDDKVEFTFNKGFKQSEVGEYDLYVKDEERQLIIGTFTYDLNNYEENTSKEILDKQVAYFLKTRNDMKIFKDETVKSYDDKTVTIVEYSGKTTDSAECIYVFSVIDFINAPGYTVYSTSVIVKDNYEEYISEVKNVLKNAKLK